MSIGQMSVGQLFFYKKARSRIFASHDQTKMDRIGWWVNIEKRSFISSKKRDDNVLTFKTEKKDLENTKPHQ